MVRIAAAERRRLVFVAGIGSAGGRMARIAAAGQQGRVFGRDDPKNVDMAALIW
jgi:hypothetical protein